jgi:protein phosphatase
MRMTVAAQTDVGRRKSNNEDSYGVFREETPGLQLFREGACLAVADGLGGHTGGEIASRLAVSHLRDMLKQPPPPPPAETDADEGPLPLVREWMKRINANIWQTNQDHVREGKPMGTTLLSAIVVPRKIYIANVGDSRCYHIRNGEIIARTRDHSWVDEQVEQGLMSKAEAEVDQRKNVVTRCIGTHQEVEPDSYTWYYVPGDHIMLCTDGLVNMVKDYDIKEEFRRGLSPAELAGRLIKLANDNGGRDNITVVVALLEPSLGTMLRTRWRTMRRQKGVHMAWGLVAALLTLVGLAAGWYLGARYGLPPF